MNDATIGGVEVKNALFASSANLTNPLLGLMLDFIGTLAFVVGNVDVYARNFSIASD